MSDNRNIGRIISQEINTNSYWLTISKIFRIKYNTKIENQLLIIACHSVYKPKQNFYVRTGIIYSDFTF